MLGLELTLGDSLGQIEMAPDWRRMGGEWRHSASCDDGQSSQMSGAGWHGAGCEGNKEGRDSRSWVVYYVLTFVLLF